ncbi:MAG TPA: sulfurtransferase [Thermoanaerobaculia bacterium]
MRSPIIASAGLVNLPHLVLLDARGSDAAYAAGHLPHAHHAQPDRYLSAPDDPRRGGRHPLPPFEQWLAQLGAWGIDRDSNVVIYDDQAGANAAARAWWMLRSVGHENVFVLDGGVDPSLEQSTEVPQTRAKPPYPATTNGWRPTATIEDVEARRNDPSWKILDVRSAERYRGETEPIDPVAGHIPGALNLPFTRNLANGRFKSPNELRAQYEQFLGDTDPDRLVVHCGSGITACHTLLALEAAGLEGASLYVGSWSEWCRNEDRPKQNART